MPRVTVVMATYNWSSVLPYSIGSALRQTFPDFELLVVGDGCTDDSEHVVASIGDPRVRWINLPVNSGHQSAPNNEGLRQARGDVIAYLGHDDLWLPHHLASLVGALDRERADLAYGIMACVGPEGRFIWPTIPRPQNGSFAPPSGMVHRRRVTDAIGRWRDFRELSPTPPEVELWRRAQAAGHRFTFVPRLTGVKLPASWRGRVYERRPSHEQAAWLHRVDSEPDFEARLLVHLIAERRVPTGSTYRDLALDFMRETLSRVRRRLSLPRNRGRTIDEIRRFKGLEEDGGPMLPGARKDAQLVTKDWQKLESRIDGVVVREVLHVPRDHGVITEIFRPEWDPTGLPVVQVYQSRLFPGAIGAWSCHLRTVDRLFVNQGHLKIVLYDGREASATSGRVMELHAGDARPALLVIPIGVWHGLQNLGASDALVLNCPSRAYDYEDPDHYRLPYDSAEIPYAWQMTASARPRSDGR